jgi:PAS domain-containing protein
MKRLTKKNTRLLVVDDNRAIHQDFRKVLIGKEPGSVSLLAAEAALFGDESNDNSSEHSFQLDSAMQGRDALELVQNALAEGQPYAMAFMDVRMPPGWDGIETTAKIWEIDPDVQIVICSAYSDYTWEKMLDKLGRSDRMVVLKKPFENIEVLQLATGLTKKWQLLQEAKVKTANLEKTVLTRTLQALREQENFKAVFENSPDGILQTTPDGRFLSANPALAAILGYASPQELMAQVTNIGEQLL